MEDHGLEVVALRAAWVSDPRDATNDRHARDRVDRLYEAVHVGGRLPGGARWVPLDDLERRPTPMGRAIDAGVLAPGQRAPATVVRPGLVRRDGGLDRRAARASRACAGAATCDRSARGRAPPCSRSRPTVDACGPSRSRCRSRTRSRSRACCPTWIPGIVPPLLAADPATGRLLMEDVGGPLLDAHPGSAGSMDRDDGPDSPRSSRCWPATWRRFGSAGVPRASMA